MSWMLIVQFLILTTVVCGALIFFLKKVLFDSTQGAVNRLNRETEQVRAQQTELKEKIKQANEELEKRKREADELVARMKTDAEEQAKEERDKVLNKARSESEEILAKAQRSKEDIRAVITKDVRMQTADLAAEILNSVLSEKATQALHNILIDEFIADLAKIDMTVVTDDVNSAEIITAVTLNDDLKTKFANLLQERVGRKIEVKASTDAKIISGVLLRLGSLALDGSLKSIINEQGTTVKEEIEKS